MKFKLKQILSFLDKTTQNKILKAIDASSFKLHPKLPKTDFKISGNLGNAENWKAKIIMANSATEDVKVGDWDDVGYVMISLKDNTIIPIARSDEHRTGYELMWDYNKKYKISPKDYMSVFVIGNNYIWQEDNGISNWLIALKKYLEWGGNPTHGVNGINELRYLSTTVKKFVESEGNLNVFKPQKGKLTDTAEQFIKELHELGTIIRTADNIKSNVGKAFLKAEGILNWFISDIQFNALTRGIDVNILPSIKILKKEKDLDKLEKLFFGFEVEIDGKKIKSFKNSIHTNVKRINKLSKTDFRKEDLQTVVGDIDKFIEMLSNI